MPVKMSGSPQNTVTGIDMGYNKTFGGDRSKGTNYKGPKHKADSRYAKVKVMADEAAGGGWGVHATGATVGMDEVQDKRNKFEKKFDDQQAAWMDNEDRNDDALYHRSFDDGSMHLVSSQYRDGKPVDNHGKEIGGMGAAAITKYRRHDVQGATSEGESATFVPLEEDNSTLRYFAASEVKNHERGYVHPDMKKKGAEPWNNAPYRAVPYSLRGLKTVTNEPWVEDVKANPETNYATSCLSRLDDGQSDSTVQMFQRRLEENSKIAANRGLMPWHESPVLWRFPSGQAGRSIEYGETATTLKNEYQYTSHIQNGHTMDLDANIGATHILR